MNGDKGGELVRSTRTLALVVAWMVLAAAPARAVFDDLDYSPRARGLGGCYAAIADDSMALLYNPAGLVKLEQTDLQGTSFQPWNLGFVRANALAFATPVGSWGAVGVAYSDFRAENQGAVLSIERAVTFGHGFTLMEDVSSSFAFGYALNVYNIDYPTPSVSGVDLGSQTTFGVDVGFMAKLHDRTTAGVFVKNLNNPSIGNPVPTDLRQRISGGFAYEPYDGVITTVEMEKEIGYDIQIHGGLEARIAEPLVLRFGVQSKPNLFDVGAGLVWRQLRVDLSWTYHPVLNGTFRYGLLFRF